MAIAEILTQQPELPEMVGDVLADVSHGAVGSHNDLGVFVRPGFRRIIAFGRYLLLSGFRRRSPFHHPAAFVLAFGLKVKHAFLLHLLKGKVPEMKVKDFALLREEVILDAEPLHGLKMTADDGVGYQLADRCGLVASSLNVMQSLQPQLEVFLVFFIPPGNAGVEIPAVVVKRYTAG